VQNLKPGVEENGCVLPLPGGNKKAWAMAFSPDGNLLAVRGGARDVFIWDVETRKLVSTLQAEDDVSDEADLVWRASQSGKGWLISGCQGQHLAIWDVNTGKLGTGVPIAAPHTVLLALSADGYRIATTKGSESLAVWKMTDGIQIASLDNPYSDVHAL